MKEVVLPDCVVNAFYSERTLSCIETYMQLNETSFFINEKVLLKSTMGDVVMAVKIKKNGIIPIDNTKVLGLTIDDLEQKAVINDILDDSLDLVIVDGVAGTGKTFISLLGALATGKQILYTRENIEVGRPLGHLPGEIEDKFNPYVAPLKDNLTEIERLTKKKFINKVTYEPVSFMRGRNIRDNQILIVDEAQNLSKMALKTLITRICQGTKAVVIGSMSQIDDKSLEKDNPYKRLISIFEGYDNVGVNRLTKERRSKIAKMVDDLL